MVRDFTLEKYQTLIEVIVNSSYTSTTVHDHLVSPSEWSVILRHDVDRAPARALDMARVEYKMGVRGSYYFRQKTGVFDPVIISKIADMGHEIGYHYETLDKAKGNISEAIRIFEQEIAEFREFADVKTVCMHGTPLARWTNSDIWNYFDFKNFDIIGEPYISIEYNDVIYLTDTGRTWAGENVRVKDIVNTRYDFNISTTNDVIDFIKSEQLSRICLLAHPNRWCDDLASWSWELLWQNTKNIGKRGIVWYNRVK